MQLRFYKDGFGWYADLPDYIEAGGTKEACAMVAGADDFLDILAQGENEVTLEIDTEPFEGADVLEIINQGMNDEEESFGAYYQVGMCKGVDYSNHQMWLCPVTLFVFGEYPERIYYK